MTTTENPVRLELIKKGLITPTDAKPEEFQCVRCGTPFARIPTRTFDTVCGRRDCRRKDSVR